MLRFARFFRISWTSERSRSPEKLTSRLLSSKTNIPDPFDSQFLNTITVENIRSNLRPWIIKCVDKTVFKELSFEEQATVFNRLLMVHCFEVFLHTKYMSCRKCLFDCEVVLPALCSLIDRSLLNGAKSFVIGLSQLSQLTTLSELMGESEEAILAELLKCRNDFSLDDVLEDDTSYLILDEDVVSEFIEPAKNQPYEISLVGPPTPASAVYPLMMGRAKALQTLDREYGSDLVWPIFCYPIVEISSQDSFNNIVKILKEPDLSAGGTIHIFINCGHASFEDSLQSVDGSSKLIKLLAEMVNTPVVNVKADEVDSVIYVMNMVSDFRANHKRDIIVNLMGSPVHPPHKNVASTRTLAGFLKEFLTGGKDPLVALYSRDLISNKLLSKVEFDDRKEIYLKKLLGHSAFRSGASSRNKSSSLDKKVKEPFTGVDAWVVAQMVEQLQNRNLFDKDLSTKSNGSEKEGPLSVSMEESFAVPINPISVDRVELKPELDWESSASLVYASLLQEGCHVHVSRSLRGPASSIDDPQKLIANSASSGEFKLREIDVSPLAMAGFQVGMSSTDTNLLSVWEVPTQLEPSALHEIVNDYFASSKTHERLTPNVAFIVPSSFKVTSSDSTSVQISCQPSEILKICEDCDLLTGFNDQLCDCNVVVASLSNPANLFHLIRRHARSLVPKPLVALVPSDCCGTCEIQDLVGETCFRPYIGDTSVLDSNIKNVVLCCGRIYYHLKQERSRREMDRLIAISRVEQLCPFPYSNLIQDMERFPSARIWWAQEEEIGDGCWSYIESRLLGLFGEERVVRFTGHYRPNGPPLPCPTLQDRAASILDVIIDS